MGRLGENGYKGVFSLALVAGLVLIVVGWRSSTPALVYVPPFGLQLFATGLLYLALLLFVVSGRPSRLKRVLRHPQLTSVALWGLAHLLLNGDSRSLVLFGGLAIWAVIEIFAINRRDRDWEKPAPPPWSIELVTVLVTAVVIAVVVYIHPWIAGVPAR